MAGPMTTTRVGSKPIPSIPVDGEIGDAPVRTDAERRDERTDGRDEFVRVRPREPHERYMIEPRKLKRDMDYQWAAAKVSGQPNPRFIEHLRAGWQPVKAEDYPELAGLDVRIDPRLVELGLVPDKRPGDPIEDRGLMLMMRPKTLSTASRAEEEHRATGQFSDHMNRLNHTSRRAIGDKTQLSRRRTSGAPPEGMIPDDADLEE